MNIKSSFVEFKKIARQLNQIAFVPEGKKINLKDFKASNLLSLALKVKDALEFIDDGQDEGQVPKGTITKEMEQFYEENFYDPEAEGQNEVETEEPPSTEDDEPPTTEEDELVDADSTVEEESSEQAPPADPAEAKDEEVDLVEPEKDPIEEEIETASKVVDNPEYGDIDEPEEDAPPEEDETVYFDDDEQQEEQQEEKPQKKPAKRKSKELVNAPNFDEDEEEEIPSPIVALEIKDAFVYSIHEDGSENQTNMPVLVDTDKHASHAKDWLRSLEVFFDGDQIAEIEEMLSDIDYYYS